MEFEVQEFKTTKQTNVNLVVNLSNWIAHAVLMQLPPLLLPFLQNLSSVAHTAYQLISETYHLPQPFCNVF